MLGDFFHRLGAHGFGQLAVALRNGVTLFGLAQLAGIRDQLHVDEVNDSGEVRALAIRHLNEHGVAVEPFDDHIHAALEIRAGAIHLVDEADARHVVAVGLPPHRLRLRLDAGHAVKYDNAAVQHAQAALHFGGEIHVAGRVNDVDLVIAPACRDRRRGDGDTALALLFHVVRRRRAFVHLADPMNHAGVVQHALGGRRLAGVNMRDDADVAHLRQV